MTSLAITTGHGGHLNQRKRANLLGPVPALHKDRKEVLKGHGSKTLEKWKTEIRSHYWHLAINNCVDMKHFNVELKCGCMVATRWWLDDSDIEDVVNFLYGYALMEQEAQRRLVAEWIRYAIASKAKSGESNKCLYLLPGALPKTNCFLCRHALARLLGMGPSAWDALAKQEGQKQRGPVSWSQR